MLIEESESFTPMNGYDKAGVGWGSRHMFPGMFILFYSSTNTYLGMIYGYEQRRQGRMRREMARGSRRDVSWAPGMFLFYFIITVVLTYVLLQI